MSNSHQHRSKLLVGWIVTLTLLLSACNLGASPEQSTDLTAVPTNVSSIATRTSLPNEFPTAVTVTPIPFPTRSQAGGITQVAVLPPVVQFPTNTPLPISIFILSPTSGNIVAGNIQVFGSATHPQFLQYRLEYGPDPNPNNLWFPLTGIVQTPVLSGVLGTWNTSGGGTPDGIYQLRLRVFLRDGRQEQTTVNNIRVQNQNPTPVPTNTPNTPRPIAAFTQDVASGNAPLVVRFTNQSQGDITSYLWYFGDGTTSNAKDPVYTYQRAGTYNITLQVTGPGGTSNVSRQISVTGINPPVASFTTDTSSGTSPLRVTFTNRSTGNIRAYNWDFGDGNTSTVASPVHTFTAVGTYNVILQVTGDGGSSSVVRQITVSNPQIPAPTAAFTPSTTVGNVPLTVTFSNTSSDTAKQFLWDFNGDGITDSIEKEPTHQYTVAGKYTVRLTVIGDGGQATATAEIDVQTPPEAPVASFTFIPESGIAPLTVAFANTSTGSGTLSYVWDFEDNGQPDSTATNPNFTYNSPGTYTVRLTTVSSNGLSATTTRTVTVTQPPVAPVASFTASTNGGTAPLTVVFTNTSSGTIDNLLWDFGDGNTSTENSPTHTYANAGTFTPTLTVVNGAGQNSFSGSPISVASAPVAPVASFTASTNGGTAPLTVVFTNTSSGTIDNLLWDFGDGNTSTENSPTHTYANAGTFTPTLTVVNGAGQNSFSGSPISVASAPVAPVASFTASTNGGTAPLTVVFTNTSSGTIDNLLWDFGDGNTSTENSPTHTYANAGTFTPTLTVVNGAGQNSFSGSPISVASAPVAPVASFTASTNGGTAPLTVVFTNTSSGTIDNLLWDFGDGNTSTENSPTHTYANAGTFTPTLTVVNGAGQNSFSGSPISVASALVAPVASFTASTNGGTAPLTVVFTNTSSGTIDNLLWDFGDGNTSTENSPTHTYANAGTFTPTLTVVNGAGQNSFSGSPISVDAPAPLPVQRDVVFSSNRNGTYDIYLSSDGGDAVNLTNTGANDTQPNLSPDGSRLVFVSDRDGNREIYVLDIGTQAVTRLTDDSADDFAPAWSNDGTRIAFVSNRNGSNDIWVMNADGSNAFPLTVEASNETSPTWSPDNGRIAFVSDRDGSDNIYVMNASDGSLVVQLTSDGSQDNQPHWSNAGIVFTSNRSGDNDIFKMDEGGGNVVQLTFSGANDQQARWVSSGIIFVSDRDGNNDVFIMDANGNGQTNVSNHPADDVQPDRR